MQVTKNDLSFNHTTLDYQALHRTAVIAFAHTRNEIERYLHETHEIGRTNFSSTAGYILKEAEQLAVVAETLHTLEEGLTREELEIVNKPEVAKEVSK